jgi:hypothetical protein
MTLLHDHALLVLVIFPSLMIGMQVLLFLFPSDADRTGRKRDLPLD